jgi:hypothetical protein
MKNITLKFTGFTVKGISELKLWGGGKGSIEMKSFDVKHLREIREEINDNGFGCEEILGAICEVYKNYNGHLEYCKEIIVGKVSESTFDAMNESYI